MTELSLVAKATAILGLALLITRAARRAPASVRALILATTFGLLLVLPIASTLAPAREMQIPDLYAPAFLMEERPDAGVPLGVVVAPNPEIAATARPWRVPSVISLARGIWALGVVATLAPLLFGLRRSRAIQRDAHDWADGAVLASTLRDSIGLRRPVSVVLHDDLVSPMTCGWRQPIIVMPADSVAWPAADVRRALLHELEHVRRHDWPVHVLARFTCALYWFHPGAWLAWRQLALESERACDDAVVARAENAAYAEQLVTLARRFGTTVRAPLLSMADRRTLATRVAAILNRNLPRERVGAGYAAAIVLGAAALSAIVAPLRAVARAEAVRDSTAVRLEPATAEIDHFVIERIERPTPNDAPELVGAVAQSTGGPAFELATVRQNTSGSEFSRGPMVRPGNRLLAQNVQARALIATAYGLQWAQIVGGPGWLNSEHWDVEARARETASVEDVRAMLRTLLAGRFGLVARHETRQQDVYELTPTDTRRPTPGLRAAADPCAPIQPAQLGVLFTPGSPAPGGAPVGEPVASLSNPPKCQRMSFPGFLAARQIRMPEFAVMLTWFAGRPVIDRSGMAGEYDIDLTFAPDPAVAAGDAVSLFTAVREQLGLKLEAARGPVEVLVIDAVERPSPN